MSAEDAIEIEFPSLARAQPSQEPANPPESSDDNDDYAWLAAAFSDELDDSEDLDDPAGVDPAPGAPTGSDDQHDAGESPTIPHDSEDLGDAASTVPAVDSPSGSNDQNRARESPTIADDSHTVAESNPIVVGPMASLTEVSPAGAAAPGEDSPASAADRSAADDGSLDAGSVAERLHAPPEKSPVASPDDNPMMMPGADEAPEPAEERGDSEEREDKSDSPGEAENEDAPHDLETLRRRPGFREELLSTFSQIYKK